MSVRPSSLPSPGFTESESAACSVSGQATSLLQFPHHPNKNGCGFWDKNADDYKGQRCGSCRPRARSIRRSSPYSSAAEARSADQRRSGLGLSNGASLPTSLRRLGAAVKCPTARVVLTSSSLLEASDHGDGGERQSHHRF